LPTGPSRPGRTAGPAFEVARPAIFFLPHRDAAWKVMAERLDALEQACGSLAREAGLGMLGQLTDQLHSISGEVHSRLAAQREQLR
jgi:hypothetical protein